MQGVARFIAGAAGSGSDTVTMVPSNLYAASYYWPARVGRSHNYEWARMLVGPLHYVWWRVGGVGFDPQPYAPELANRIGVRVDLVDNDNATNNATATAAAIDALPGWSAIGVGANVLTTGPGLLSSSVSWDARGGGGFLGMLSARGGAAGYNNARANGSCNAACLTAAATGVITFLDVYIGTAAGTDLDRFWLTRGTSTTTPVMGSVVAGDFGQIPVVRSANGWVRLRPATPISVTLGEILWLTWNGTGNTTDLGFYDTGSANQISNFTAQAFRTSTGAMPTNPAITDVVPWTGAVSSAVNRIPMFRMGYQTRPLCSTAQLHSTLDPLVVGAHITAAQNTSVLAAVDAWLSQTTQLNSSIGPVISVAMQMCVAVHGTDQPRMGLYTRADFTNPEVPVIENAVLAVDGGRMTGVVANDWVSVPAVALLTAGSVITPFLVHGGPAGPGTPTTIRYTDFANWNDSDPIDAPSDWVRPAVPGAGVGPEVASLVADPPLEIDPALPLPAAIPAVLTAPLRPGNVGGTRGLVRCEGLLFP